MMANELVHQRLIVDLGRDRPMQSICRLSRRWHQQFCHSPSFGPHQQCFQVLGPSRGLRQARGQVKALRNDSDKPVPNARASTNSKKGLSPAALLSREGDDLVVREYEQHGSDASTLRAIKPDTELSDEVDTVWSELQDVDRELAILRQGPFGPQSDFMQQFSPEDREKILSGLAQEGYVPQEEEDLLDLAEIDRLLEEEKADSSKKETFEVELGTSAGHQALTKHFNKVLLEAKDEKENELKSLRLWKWYVQCQEKIPGFSRNIPANVWKFLWSSQLRLREKPQHLVRLGREILNAQIEMEARVWSQFIEALLSCGHLEEARSTWEDLRSDSEIDKDKKFLFEFYTIGIRIYGSLNQPVEAQNLAFQAIQKGARPTILVQSIVAWANSDVPGSAAKAWTAYLKLLKLMGNKMNPSIYQEVSDALLQSGNKDMALTIFKDLIRSIRNPESDTLAAYEKALGNADTNREPQEIEDAINKVSLTMLLALPSGYHNKFFFSSWIKHLIGAGRTEAAAMVVDLMYERGIKPDAIHLNGLLGAWLRENSPEACQRAEDLANEMIQAKVNRVAAVSEQRALQIPSNLFRRIFVLDNNGRIPLPSVQKNRFLPAANHETFSLMFDYYEKKRRWHDFNDLTKTFLGPAQLRPNIFITNKLLAAELQNNAFGRFWAIYEDLAQKLGPNLETFDLIWHALAQQGTGKNFLNTIGRGPIVDSHVVSTEHRQHFASLMDWMNENSGRHRKAAIQDFNEAFYGEVTKSLVQSLDLPGMICVMHGLYQVFGHAPSDAAIQLILVSVARALPRSDTARSTGGGRRRAMRAEFGADQTKLKKIANIVDTVEAELKMSWIENENVDPDKFQDRESAEFKRLRVDVITEFLMLMMQNITNQNPLTIHDAVTAAAKTMHVDLGKGLLARSQIRMQEVSLARDNA